jgi:hypothetical protein
MPASPANVSGRAPRDHRRLRVVPQPEPVRPARSERDHVLRRRAQLDADDVVVHVDAEDDRVDRLLELLGETGGRARDDRRGRQPEGDLLGDVRPGEHRHGPVPDERREAAPGLGVEALGEAEHRRVALQPRDGLREGGARDGDDDELRLGHGRLGQRAGPDAAQVGAGHVARVAAGRRDRVGLPDVAAREHDVVPALPEDDREGGAPRAAAEDDDPHSLRTKSIETGTPSRLNRLRSSFSTQ